jgi:hypothetical protein
MGAVIDEVGHVIGGIVRKLDAILNITHLGKEVSRVLEILHFVGLS